MRPNILNVALLGAVGLFAVTGAAQAHGGIGFSFSFAPPAVYAPPPVYYPPAYYAPAPVYRPPSYTYYYEPRRYYRPPIVQYAPPSSYYYYSRPGYTYRHYYDDYDD